MCVRTALGQPIRYIVRRKRVCRSPVAACLLATLVDTGCATRPPSIAPAVTPPGITWLIFIDDLHINFRNTGRVRLLLRTISTELIRDEDMFAVRSSGPGAINLGATSDRASLEASIRTVIGAGLHQAEIEAAAGRSDIASFVPYMTHEIARRLGLTVSAASELLGTVPASPNRRRVLLYISNGFDFDTGRARATEVSAAARRANVVVFAMNADGLPGSQAPSSGVDAAFWEDVAASRRQSLRTIAEPTGGFALLDEGDFTDAMSRIRASLK